MASAPKSGVAKIFRNRAPGLKLLLISGLILLMGIPALFVYLIVYDRSERADETRREIAAAAGGEQSVIGPVLAIPVQTRSDKHDWEVTDTLIVFADTGSASAKLDVSTRKKSLYAVQVYQGKISFKAHFSLGALARIGDDRTRLVLTKAKIMIGISDSRGALGDAWLETAGQKPRLFEPYIGDFSLYETKVRVRSNSMNSLNFAKLGQNRGNILSAPAGDLLNTGTLDIKARLPLGGARRFAFLPFARSTSMKIAANWPNPGFDGDFLPTQKTITDTGFSASRTIPSLASAIPAMAFDSDLSGWNDNRRGMEVKLVEKSSPYQYVSRSLKYALMFIGFVFLTFFLFEILDDRPVHAAQYVLVGIAQTVFYLLLLAFSERIGFDGAFAIAATATVGLIGAYAGAVFGKRRALAAFAIFGIVYALMFVLMRLQDYALMVGSLASFTAIAITMWMTRKIDWYGAAEKRFAPDKPA